MPAIVVVVTGSSTSRVVHQAEGSEQYFPPAPSHQRRCTHSPKRRTSLNLFFIIRSAVLVTALFVILGIVTRAVDAVDFVKGLLARR